MSVLIIDSGVRIGDRERRQEESKPVDVDCDGLGRAMDWEPEAPRTGRLEICPTLVERSDPDVGDANGHVGELSARVNLDTDLASGGTRVLNIGHLVSIQE